MFSLLKLTKVSAEIVFIFSASVHIKKNARKSLFSTCSEKLDFSFFLLTSREQSQLKKNFVGTDKKNTCAKPQRNIINSVWIGGPRIFRFSDKRSGFCETTILGLKLYTVFFIA